MVYHLIGNSFIPNWNSMAFILLLGQAFFPKWKYLSDFERVLLQEDYILYVLRENTSSSQNCTICQNTWQRKLPG